MIARQDLVRWLSLAAAFQLLGYGILAFKQDLPVHTGQLETLGMSPALAGAIPYLLGSAMIAVAGALTRSHSARLLWTAAGAVFFLVLLKHLGKGASFAVTMLPESVKFLLPATAALLVAGRIREESALSTLKVAVAFTFIGHGIEGLMHNPKFVTLLEAFSSKVIELDPEIYPTLLDLIGIADIAVALALLYTRLWPVSAYMGAWALLTASSRVLAGGWTEVDQVLIRVAYFSVPLILMIQTMPTPWRQWVLRPFTLAKSIS